MSKKALLVGINYIGTSNELKGCINDVLNIKQCLQTHYGFKPYDIKVLTDDSSENKPTCENIINGMKWLMEGAKAGDRLFFQYSGHGYSIRDYSGDEEDGKDEVLIPCDYNTDGVITDDFIRKELCEKVPKDCKLTCLFDCCNSGTSADLRYHYKQNTNNTVEIIYYPNYAPTDGRVLLISGCMDVQTSADAYISNQFQGAMTYSLLRTLKHYNYKLSYRRLIKKMREYLSANGYSQIPQMTSGKRLRLSNLFRI